MKKIYLFVLAAIATTASWADSRSAQQMLRIAQQKLGTSVTEAQTAVNGAKGATVDNQAYATFNAQNGKGFVIVGADDRLPEILGYSTSGAIDTDNMPPALKDALNNLGKALPYMNTYKPTGKEYTPVDTLIKTLWYQTAPYNNYCPTYTDEYGHLDTCATGCAATALAQVIYYWGKQGKFPKQGKDTICWKSGSAEDPNTYYPNLTFDFSTPFDFDNMQDYYGTTYFNHTRKNSVDVPYSEEKGNAVAKLMQACGALTKMQYGPESGTTMNYLDRILKYYDFGTGSRILIRAYYTEDEWMEIIQEQLQKGYPILYRAQTLDFSGGHAFIFDGIDKDGNVHVNWGWTGLSHGYFNINYLFPDTQGTGGTDSPEAYNTYNGMVVDFAPDENTPRSEYSCNLINYNLLSQSINYNGFTTTSHIRKAEVAVMATNVQTEICDTINITSIAPDSLIQTELTNSELSNRNTIVPVKMDFSKFKDGVYLLQTYTKDPGQPDWSLVRTPLCIEQKIYVTIENGIVTDAENYIPNLNFNVKFALTDSTKARRALSDIPFTMTIQNGKYEDINDIIFMLHLENVEDKECAGNAYISPNMKTGATAIEHLNVKVPKAGTYRAFVDVQFPNNIDFIYTDTAYIDVDNTLLDTTNVSYPGDYYKAEPYVCDQPFNVNFWGVATASLDNMYTYMYLMNTDSVIVYQDSLLYGKMAVGDTIKATMTMPASTITPGTYLLGFSVGNKQLDDTLTLGVKNSDKEINRNLKKSTGFIIKAIEPTAIREVSNYATVTEASPSTYDLFGRRVNATTYRGIMIQNGKKRIVK